MKTALINPNSSRAKGINKATIEPPLGIGYLATYLKEKGMGCRLIDANILQLNEKEILNRLDTDTKIIGISFNIVSATAAFQLIKYLKPKLSDSVFIAGGPYPSSLPERCLSEFGFNAVCVGEGEETLFEIVKNANAHKLNIFEGVYGVCYMDGNKIVKNPPRVLIKKIDDLPFIDYALFPDISLYKVRARAKPVGTILTSRGCPFQCTYCNKNIFHATYRVRSVDNVIGEIQQQIHKFKIRQLDFLDDNLTLNMAYAHNLFDEIIKRNFNLHINLQNGVRADLLDEGLIKKMKKSGVFKVSIGVESGDADIQRTIKKSLNLNKVIEATRLFKKSGIKVYGNFMFGLPGDSNESMQKTIDFAIKMDPDIANFMITIPLPGTELYGAVKTNGLFFENIENGLTHGFYGGKIYYILDGMNKDDILKFYKKSYKIFYFRPKKIFEIISGINSFYEFKWLCDAIVETSKSIF